MNLKYNIILIVLLLLIHTGGLFAQNPVLTIQNGHQKPIRYGAMSPNNAYVISIDEYYTAILWDMVLEKQLTTFNDVLAAEFADDGRSIYLVLQTAKLKQIDLNGKVLNEWSLTSFDKLQSWNRWFFQEKKLLLQNGYLHNFNTGKSQRIYAKEWGTEHGYSPVKNLVGVGGKAILTLSDATDGKQIAEIPLGISKRQNVYKVEFSKDGNHVLAGEMLEYQLIDVNSRNVIHTFKREEAIFGALFSHDDKKVILADKKKLSVWDVKTGELIREVAHDCEIDSRIDVAFGTNETFKLSPDGSKILYCGGRPSRIQIFNAESLILEKKIVSKNVGYISNLFLTSDSKTLTTTTGRQLLHWNLSTGDLSKPIKIQKDNSSGYIDISGDGKTLIAAGPLTGAIEVTDCYTGNIQKKIVVEDNLETTGLYPIRFTNDQKYIAAIRRTDGSGQDYLSTWSFPTCKMITKSNPTVSIALFNKSNTIIIRENLKSTILKLLDIPSGKVLDELDTNEEGDFDKHPILSNNDKLLAIPLKKGIKIMDIKDMSEQLILEISEYIVCYTFSKDDKYFLVGTGKGDILVFNTLNGELEHTLAGHIGGVSEIKFHNNGQFFFANSFGENQIRVWNFKTKKLAATMYPLNYEGDWAVICPDGRFEANPTAMKSMYYVKGVTVIPLESLFEKFYTPNLIPSILSEVEQEPLPLDINTLKEAPTIKINIDNQQRNLIVEEDISSVTVNQAQLTLSLKADCPLVM